MTTTSMIRIIAAMQRSSLVAPTVVFLIVIVTVFSTEAVIMLGPLASHPFSEEAARVAMADATVLVAVLCPVLWLSVVRPLRLLSLQRGRLLRRLFEVQETERARLARDLHDGIGQSQTAILLGLRSVLAAADLERARERAQIAYDMASGAIDATRRLARGLSPAILKDFGIAQALQSVCTDLQAATSIEISCDATPDLPRLDHETEVTLFRLAQEALTNAVRHADATSIRVQLENVDDRVRLRVADNGKGMTPEPRRSPGSGLGVAGMRERARLHGGKFQFHSSPQSGTVVEVSFPSGDAGHE